MSAQIYYDQFGVRITESEVTVLGKEYPLAAIRDWHRDEDGIVHPSWCPQWLVSDVAENLFCTVPGTIVGIAATALYVQTVGRDAASPWLLLGIFFGGSIGACMLIGFLYFRLTQRKQTVFTFNCDGHENIKITHIKDEYLSGLVNAFMGAKFTSPSRKIPAPSPKEQQAGQQWESEYKQAKEHAENRKRLIERLELFGKYQFSLILCIAVSAAFAYYATATVMRTLQSNDWMIAISVFVLIGMAAMAATLSILTWFYDGGLIRLKNRLMQQKAPQPTQQAPQSIQQVTQTPAPIQQATQTSAPIQQATQTSSSLDDDEDDERQKKIRQEVAELRHKIEEASERSKARKAQEATLAKWKLGEAVVKEIVMFGGNSISEDNKQWLIEQDPIYQPQQSREPTEEEWQLITNAFSLLAETCRNQDAMAPEKYRVFIDPQPRAFALGEIAYISFPYLLDGEVLPAVIAYLMGWMNGNAANYMSCLRNMAYPFGLTALKDANPKYDEKRKYWGLDPLFTIKPRYTDPKHLRPNPIDVAIGGGNVYKELEISITDRQYGTAMRQDHDQGMTAAERYTKSLMQSYKPKLNPVTEEDEPLTGMVNTYEYFTNARNIAAMMKHYQFEADRFAAFDMGQRDNLIYLLDQHKRMEYRENRDTIHFFNPVAERIERLLSLDEA